MTDKQLSPASQAVLDAFLAEWPDEPLEQDRQCLAAAVRAVADEVAPTGYEKVWKDSHWVEYEKENPVRKKLFAIANELEGK